jgi:leucyl-tRNA synthetase
LEETGYKNVINGKVLGGQVRAEYFATHKDQNRISFTSLVLFDLENEEQEEISEEEKGIHEIIWKDVRGMTPTSMVHAEMDIWLERLRNEPTAYEEEGVLINSGEFSGLASREAMKKIGEKYGKWETQFRLRDWLVSRQRYWGVPIPMIFCEGCAAEGKGEQKDMPGWYAEQEKNLPVTLPFVENFKPVGTGESPLSSVKEFYEVKCPSCGASAKRETDVADTFLDSSWYYLGYLLASKNFKESLDSKKMQELFKRWLPIPMYIGGAEHSVLHLLYVRFITMALKDAGVVAFEEPITRFRAHGLLIKDGAKMSKSKGNVINPDDYIKRFGADAFRTYLMFLAPFEDGGDFRDEGLLGPVRFLERVWKFGDIVKNQKSKIEEKGLEKNLHKTIQKVTEDIENLRYNTALSALMILLNDFEKEKQIPEEYFRVFIKLLAPFAPFINNFFRIILWPLLSVY